MSTCMHTFENSLNTEVRNTYITYLTVKAQTPVVLQAKHEMLPKCLIFMPCSQARNVSVNVTFNNVFLFNLVRHGTANYL